MIDKKNEETVAKLYAIRAGMSVISKERDAFQADFAKVRKQKEGEYQAKLGVRAQQQAKHEEAEKQRQEIDEQASELLHKSFETQDKIDDVKKKIRGKMEAIDKPKFRFLLPLAAFGLVLAALLITGIVAVENDLTNDGGFYGAFYGFWPDETWFGILVIIAIAVGAIGGLICGGYGIASLRDYISDKQILGYHQRDLKKLEAQAASEKAAYDAAWKKKYAIDLPTVTQVGAPDYDALRKDCGKRNKHVKAGAAFYALLVKEFSPTLDPRDWGNVDYLIYAFETGRARDLTEALQMCDRELQTQRVEKAIKSATAEITATIRRGLGNLQAQMETCFYNLSQQVAASTSKVTEAIAETNAQIEKARKATEQTNARLAGVQSSLAQMTTAAAMNNALLAKANESSSALADDVHRLRLYADGVI